jgi:regulator of ribonuclease activity A
MVSMNPAIFSTPDLCDMHPEQVRVLDPLFRSYGGHSCFGGEIVTVKCFEDNSRVKELAAQDGRGKVMVVDGGGSLRRALLGDLVAESAVRNGWAGFLIFGCVRDVAAIAALPLGIMALNACPVKTERKNIGDVNVPIAFAGQAFHPGEYIYADGSGILVSSQNLIA